MVAPGEDVTLSCSVEGKPLTEEHVRWEREDYDIAERTEATFANGTSYLHIRNAQREDVGNFRCIADNRVANPTSRDVLLIVKCKCATESLGSSVLPQSLILSLATLFLPSQSLRKSTSQRC